MGCDETSIGAGERETQRFSTQNSTRFFNRFPEPRQLQIWVCVFRLPAGEAEQHQQRLARETAMEAMEIVF